MFEIGFFEICFIAIIALLVIGPEKLPRVARTTGLWIGKARGMVKTVKYEIDEQIRMEELKQSLDTASNRIKETVTDSVEPVQNATNALKEEIDSITTEPSNKKNS